MLSKFGLSVLLILLPILTFAQNQPSAFRVFEDGKKIELPDSLEVTLSENTDQIEKYLLSWFSSAGFLDATVISKTDSSAQVSRGCQFQLSILEVNFAGEIDSMALLKPDIPYTEKTLRDKLRDLIYQLEEKGYPFAKARITSINPIPEKCEINMVIQLDTDMKISQSEIYFNGAKSNSQDYLRKISRYNPMREITPSYLRLLQSNLNSSGLFNSVEPAQIFFRNEEPVIVFQVQERSLNRFDGLLGYVPDASGNGQIVGDVELTLWNVLTQGNGFDFRYQRLQPETSQLNLGASQDWMGNIPLGFSLGFQLYQNDTTYQSRDFDLDGYYLMGSGIKLIGGVGFQNTTSGNELPTVVEPDGQKRTARLGFEYINLDRYDVPTSGSSVRLILGIANKDLADDSSASFRQNTLNFNAHYYIPLFDKGVVATSVHGFLLESDKITTNDLIRFGGANSLRGYAEQQFRASKMLWGDIEYRFLLNRNSYIFGFGAAGGFHRPRLLTEINNNFRITKYLFSTGFGLSYQTQIGRLKFTYAISPEESIGNGKVHFGIRTEL